MNHRAFARSIACFITTLALAACSGGKSAPGLPAVSGGAPGSPQSVDIVIKIPSKTASSTNPKYVSPSTQSGSVTVTDSSGTRAPVIQNVAGSTITLKALAAPGNDSFNITLFDQPNGAGKILTVGQITRQIVLGGANAFTVVNGGVVATFNLTLSNQFAPAGTPLTQTVTFSALDADQNLIVGPFDTPVILTDDDTSGSTSLSTRSIAGSSTAVTLSYDGSQTLAAATISAATTSSSTAANGTGALGRVTFTPQSTYTGLRLYASMQPHFVNGGTDLPPQVRQYRLQPGVGIGTQLPSLNIPNSSGTADPMAVSHDSAKQLYVAINDYYGTPGIEIYPQASVGNTAPSTSITSASVGADLSRPWQMSIDKSGNIFIGNAGGSAASGPDDRILRLSPNGVGGYFTAAQITAVNGYYPQPYFVALNPVTGNLYANVSESGQGSYGSDIAILSPNATGNAPELDRIQSSAPLADPPFWYFSSPSYAAFAPDGTLYTTGSYAPPGGQPQTYNYATAVLIFAPGAGSASSPVRVIYGTNAGLTGDQAAPGYTQPDQLYIGGIAIDQNGYLYLGIAHVSNDLTSITNTIEVFPSNANGNVAPIQTITLQNCNCLLRSLDIF